MAVLRSTPTKVNSPFKEAGLLDAFKSNSRLEGEAIEHLNLEGKVTFDSAGINRGKPEINGIKLRDRYLDA